MKVLPFGNYQPDPRNGKVYGTSQPCILENDGTSLGYTVVHMAVSEESASFDVGYATMADAEAAAYKQARRCNAVFVPSDKRGQS